MNPTDCCKTCELPKSEDDFYYHSPGVLANECKLCKLQRNERHKVRQRYGLSVDEWRELRKRPCDICATTQRKRGIDHDHETGALRGVLCSTCNHGIGSLGDDPQRLLAAVAYLKSPPGCAD